MRTIRALLWGCAFGMCLGLLFAPKRGEETRADAQRWFTEWQNQAKARLREVRDKAPIAFEQGRQEVQTALDQEYQATRHEG